MIKIKNNIMDIGIKSDQHLFKSVYNGSVRRYASGSLCYSAIDCMEKFCAKIVSSDDIDFSNIKIGKTFDVKFKIPFYIQFSDKKTVALPTKIAAKGSIIVFDNKTKITDFDTKDDTVTFNREIQNGSIKYYPMIKMMILKIKMIKNENNMEKQTVIEMEEA